MSNVPCTISLVLAATDTPSGYQEEDTPSLLLAVKRKLLQASYKPGLAEQWSRGRSLTGRPWREPLRMRDHAGTSWPVGRPIDSRESAFFLSALRRISERL
jgi:hypothetical protein